MSTSPDKRQEPETPPSPYDSMDESYTSQDDMDTGDSSEVHKPTMMESTDGSLSPGTRPKAVFATGTYVKATRRSKKKKKNKNLTPAESDIEETNEEKVDEEIEMENQDGDPINPTLVDPPVDGHVVTKGAREIYGDDLIIPIPTALDLTPEALEKRVEDLEKHRLFLLEEAARIVKMR